MKILIEENRTADLWWCLSGWSILCVGEMLYWSNICVFFICIVAMIAHLCYSETVWHSTPCVYLLVLNILAHFKRDCEYSYMGLFYVFLPGHEWFTVKYLVLFQHGLCFRQITISSNYLLVMLWRKFMNSMFVNNTSCWHH